MKVSKKRFLKDLEESVELMKNGVRVPYSVLSVKDGVDWMSKMIDKYAYDKCTKDNDECNENIS